MANFEQFFRAIAEQESNNNYKAVGVLVRGNRAYGKYQVMDFNIPSWTKQYYGTTLTPQQFLNNPAAQEAVARGKLKSYFDQYGERGAASAWYSGNPKLHMSTNKQSGGPSIKGYVDSVLKKANGYPASGGGSSTSSGSSGGGGGGTAPLARNEQAEQYGFVEGMLNSIPELKNLFNKATSGGWTASKFQAELRNTTWFKTKSESERQFIIKQYGDPATVAQMWNVNQTKVWQLAGKTGVKLNWDQVNNFAYGIMALGWTEEKLRQEMAQTMAGGVTDLGGEAGKAIEEIKAYGFQMGYIPDDWNLSAAAQRIVNGSQTMEDWRLHVRQVAKGIYSNWADQIDAGQTVMSLASPYLQSMATILELPPGSVTLDDPTIKKTLQAKDPQTGANRIKQLWEFENELRGDDRWKKTQNAQNSTMQVAHQVLSDFGFKY